MALLLFVVALLAIPRPACSSTSSSSNGGAALQPTLTFCSGGQSPAAVSSGELASFLDAVCAGAAHGVAHHMSHNMSLHVAAENRTLYGVAQCRPDVPVPDCAACLAAASSRLTTGTAVCAASAVWLDACFLRYSYSDHGHGDSSRFREDEYTATVFNASRALPPPHEAGKGAVRRLLAAVKESTLSSHMYRGVGAGTGSGNSAGGQMVYGLARCAAGVSCADCRRCLRGALATAEREYNGSAGMQVLRLSCMARYESHPFFNATSPQLAHRRTLTTAAAGGGVIGARGSLGGSFRAPASAQPTPATSSSATTVTTPAATHAQPTPAPPGAGGRTPTPSAPAAPPPPPPSSPSSTSAPGTVVVWPPEAIQPDPFAPPGGHTTPQPPAAASPEEKRVKVPIILIVPSATGIAVIAIVVGFILHRRRKQPTQMGHVLGRVFNPGRMDNPGPVRERDPGRISVETTQFRSGWNFKFKLPETENPDRKPVVSRRETGNLNRENGVPRENMYDLQGKEQQWSTEVEEDDDGEATGCQLYSYHVLEAATCHFSSRNKLGSGGFGTVFKGTLESGKEVAVKRLRDSKRNIHELKGEISIVADLRHKNLVRFLGYCLQDEGTFFIYEYVPNNSLAKFWYEASFHSQKLDWATWFNIILGVARGLRFLHDKGIIHRDLKPHNVLLDENFNPKIADFDLMRVYDKEKTHESTEKIAGTFGYMAPECTTGRKFLLSIKSDVYSYGVLVLEIITGHKIYTFEGQNSEGLVEYVWQHWREKRSSDVVDGDLLGLGVEAHEHARQQALRCVHVALLCVQADRSRRPTMGEVIAMLGGDYKAEVPNPSVPGYIMRPATASGVRLLCLGYR